MTENVKIKSLAKATVGLTVPELNLRRTWARKGAVQLIPMELLEQAIFSPGVEYMFKTGLLFIDDLETRIKLGLEEEEATPKTAQLIALTDEKIKELFEKTGWKDFKETLEKLSLPQLEELADGAITLKVTDYQRCKLLQEKTGKDVLKIVMRNNEEEAADNAKTGAES